MLSAIKKIVAVAALFILFQAVYSWELGVDKIEVIEENTLSVVLSENPNLELWELDAEVTVLQDIDIKWGFTSELSPNQVEVLLYDNIEADTSYSLLSVSGAEGSIDFVTESDFFWTSYINFGNTDASWIEEVKVIDANTLMIIYSENVTSSVVEYKLLAEKEVAGIEKPDYYEPELLITMSEAFVWETDYILMFIELQDVDGNYLEFDTGIYDFTTPEIDSLYESYMDDTWAEEDIPEIVEEETLQEDESENDAGLFGMSEGIEWVFDDITDFISPSDEPRVVEFDEQELPELESAPELMQEEEMQWDIEEVALLAEETPDTGTATWVIILGTLFINTFFYLSRRKRK